MGENFVVVKGGGFVRLKWVFQNRKGQEKVKSFAAWFCFCEFFGWGLVLLLFKKARGKWRRGLVVLCFVLLFFLLYDGKVRALGGLVV